MEHELEIKEEPVWVEEPADTSVDSCINNNVDNDDIVKGESQTLITPKAEDEALDPGSEDPEMMPIPGFKVEVILEEPTVDQPVPCFEEEDNVMNDAVLTEGTTHSCDVSCKTLSKGSDDTCHFLLSRPYCCSVCNSRFAYKGNLKRHLLSHTGQKEYSCSICNSKFGRKATLTRHMSIHSEERPFCCDICNSTFTNKNSLHCHISTHSGYRPHMCSICKSKFARRANLKRHMTIHSQIKRTYCCPICKRTFPLERFLNVHMLSSHSGEGL